MNASIDDTVNEPTKWQQFKAGASKGAYSGLDPIGFVVSDRLGLQTVGGTMLNIPSHNSHNYTCGLVSSAMVGYASNIFSLGAVQMVALYANVFSYRIQGIMDRGKRGLTMGSLIRKANQEYRVKKRLERYCRK